MQNSILAVVTSDKNARQSNSEQPSVITPQNATATLDPFAQHLLSEALTWLGTPFGKGQCVKQVAVDCGNFVDACFKAAGVETKEIPKTHIAGEVMLDLLEQSILRYVERDQLQPADVIAFSDENNRHPDEPVHLAFVHEIPIKTTFIIEAGIRGVVRHRLNSLWWSRAHSMWTIDKEVRTEINQRFGSLNI